MSSKVISPEVSEDLGKRFFEDGYLFPVRVFEPDEIAAYHEQLESLERDLSGVKVGNKAQLNFPHILFCFASEMTRNERLLDVVESILGPNILIWGSTFFIKEPRSEGYVSWHQDLKYWGLSDDDAQVSAWIALNEVNKENGCMQFLPKTHKGAMLDHKDTFEESNFLTRGQEADFDLDPNSIVHVELAAGEVSFHHGKLLHASPPNTSERRRIGLAVQFIAPHVEQKIASKDFAMLARGEDRYGNFELIEPPQADLSEAGIATHGRVLAAQNEAMYEGTNKPPAARN